MSDLNDLYQDLIIDHSKKPHNFRVIEHPSAKADGYNPLCGDRVTMFITLNPQDPERIQDIAFQGSGCAISTSSASVLTDMLKGKTIPEMQALFEKFHNLVTGKPISEDGPDLGKLAMFSGVKTFPTRVKCATLAWHTVRAAIEHKNAPISTE